MMKIMLIALGGALGAVFRYWMYELTKRYEPGPFVLGALAANVLGCLAVGILGGFFLGPWAAKQGLRVFLLVGFLGGFTTFSAYGWDTLVYGMDGHRQLFIANIFLHNALGIAAVWVGYKIYQFI